MTPLVQSIEWSKMLLLGGIGVLVIAISDVLRRLSSIPTEITRKIVHVTFGIIASSFPFLFSHVYSVFLLCLFFFILMLITKITGKSESIHNIDRRSLGVFAYPLAVSFIFYLANRNWLYYVVPVLLLAVSDALAALAGRRYGMISYTMLNHIRTLEGSTAFFISSFIIILICILLSHETENESAILVAILLALIITGIEAISILGLDNILIPIMGYFFISKFMSFDLKYLTANIVILLLSFMFSLAISNRLKRFSFSVCIVLTLILYCIYLWMDNIYYLFHISP